MFSPPFFLAISRLWIQPLNPVSSLRLFTTKIELHGVLEHVCVCGDD